MFLFILRPAKMYKPGHENLEKLLYHYIVKLGRMVKNFGKQDHKGFKYKCNIAIYLSKVRKKQIPT